MTVPVDSFCVGTAKGEWIYLTLDPPFWGIKKYKFFRNVANWVKAPVWLGSCKTAININNQ